MLSAPPGRRWSLAGRRRILWRGSGRMACGGGLNSGRRSVSLAALAALLAASPASPSGETVVRTLGTLPPGKTVVVRFSAIVNAPFPAGATQVSTQGTVTGTNFSSVPTDDPDAGGTAD